MLRAESDHNCAARLERENWYQSAPGAFALFARKKLVRRIIAGWPRRGHCLLEVFSGAGHFLHSFWGAGLDVTGQEHCADLAALCAARMGHRAELFRQNPERLPFDDNSFDYVACLNFEFASDPEALVKEMLRLSGMGLLLGFRSPFSLDGLGEGLTGLARKALKKKEPDGRAWARPGWGGERLFPGKAWMLARKVLAESSLAYRVRWGGILPGPVWTWKRSVLGSWASWTENPRRISSNPFQSQDASAPSAGAGGPGALPGRVLAGANLMHLPLPLGAYVVLRIDLAPSVAGTPLLLPA